MQTVSSAVYKKPFAVTGPQTGWASETQARPETDSPTLAELSFPTMKLYAMPAATSSLLEDAAIDIDAWIAGEVETAFAEQESTAFVNGDGVNKPGGFLDHTIVDEDTWSWGNLSASELIKIIHAGLLGGGHDLSESEVSQMRVENGIGGYVDIAARLLTATFTPTPESGRS